MSNTHIYLRCGTAWSQTNIKKRTGPQSLMHRQHQMNNKTSTVMSQQMQQTILFIWTEEKEVRRNFSSIYKYILNMYIPIYLHGLSMDDQSFVGGLRMASHHERYVHFFSFCLILNHFSLALFSRLMLNPAFEVSILKSTHMQTCLRIKLKIPRIYVIYLSMYEIFI